MCPWKWKDHMVMQTVSYLYIQRCSQLILVITWQEVYKLVSKNKGLWWGSAKEANEGLTKIIQFKLMLYTWFFMKTVWLCREMKRRGRRIRMIFFGGNSSVKVLKLCEFEVDLRIYPEESGVMINHNPELTWNHGTCMMCRRTLNIIYQRDV